MHVLHVTDVLPPGLGGVESALSTLFEGLPDVRVTVLAPSSAIRDRASLPAHVSVRVLDMREAVEPALMRLLPRGWRQHTGLLAYPLHEWERRHAAAALDVDVVHLHSFAAFRYFANFAARHPGRGAEGLVDWLRSFQDYGHPVLFTDHSLFGGPRTQFESIRNGLLVERLEHIVCVERSGKENVDAYARERGLRVRSWWIPNPIDTDRFVPAPFPPTTRLVVGYAGRYRKKGMEDIVRIIRAAPAWVEFRLAVAIDEQDRPYVWSELEGDTVHVSWNLPNAEMPAFYQSLHVFLDPWSWGAPRTSLEALSCGRVVVRLQAEDANAQEFPSHISLVVARTDADVLFEELSRFRDRETLVKMGNASRRFAEEQYSIRKVAEAYRGVYGLVAGSKD